MATPKLSLTSEVKYLKGVGPARAQILATRGIRTVEDLLYYTPFRYEDRTRLTRIRDLVPGQTTTVLVRVLTCGLTRTRRTGTDRKSTRLNSSHHSTSYAVFCL